jgi:hypothetical protein
VIYGFSFVVCGFLTITYGRHAFIPAPWPLGANNFLLDQKVIKKSSSLKALAFGHHSKKQPMLLAQTRRFLFVMLHANLE